MRNRVLISVLTLLATLAGAIPATAQVVPLQLDPSNFSAQELTLLSGEMARLDSLLGDTTLGPQRKLGQDGWSQDAFARFSAGSLAERGYPVYLARSQTNVWVFAGLVVDGRTVWIPIEPSPLAGETQSTLGRIPLAGGFDSLLLQSRYLSFESTTGLGPNTSPSAALRAAETSITVGESIRLIASGSSDPDGRIVLYRWCLGGSCEATTSWTHILRIDAPGAQRITLFVVDDGGRSASATIQIQAWQRVDEPAPPSGGCGCGS
jgi:hypothetical protein